MVKKQAKVMTSHLSNVIFGISYWCSKNKSHFGDPETKLDKIFFVRKFRNLNFVPISPNLT